MDLNDLSNRSISREACRSGDARKWRLAMDVSVRETAEAIGVDAATLSRWERQLSRPTGEAASRHGELIAQWLVATGAVEVI